MEQLISTATGGTKTGGENFNFGTWWNSMTTTVAPPAPRQQKSNSTNNTLIIAAFFVLAIVMLGIFNITAKKM